MRRRIVLGLALLLVLGSVAVLAMRPAGLQWRADMVRKKISGDSHGMSWGQVVVTMFPGSWGVRRFVSAGPDHWVRDLDFPVKDEREWKMYNLYVGETSSADSFDAHLTVLPGGKIPHDYHQHTEEELIIPLSGEVDVLRAKDAAGAGPTSERVGPGKFVYHASNDFHTIRGAGPEPSSYMVFKWASASPEGSAATALPSSTFEFDSGDTATDPGFKMKLILEKPTLFLHKLHAHYSTMQPGAGYDAHPDPYDVAIVALEGTLETIGKQITSPSVIFYSAHQAHGMRNPGSQAAKYLVFEFHREPADH